MIFGLLKMAIWIAGASVVAYFAIQLFGYEVNWNYWNDSRTACQTRLEQCRKDLVRTGLEGAKENCDWKCVNPKLLIRKNIPPSTQETPQT